MLPILANALPPVEAEPISAPIKEIAWYMKPVNLFGLGEIPMLIVIILAVLLVAVVILFIGQGYVNELKRQKEEQLKAQKKAQKKSSKGKKKS